MKDSRCSVSGTSEVIDPGNADFCNHPPSGYKHYFRNISGEVLRYSHINRTHRINRIPAWDKKSFRIYSRGLGVSRF